MLHQRRAAIRNQAMPVLDPLDNAVSYDAVIKGLVKQADLTVRDRAEITHQAVDLINRVRRAAKPSMMESFLAEYGLSTQEGVALMTLAEALLRTPDAMTIDELINDKLSVGAWEKHIGQSHSAIVNSATWGLLLTGKVLTKSEEKSILSATRQMVRRLGEPVIRTAVATAMRRLGKQFVLGTTIDEAFKEGTADTKKGYRFSFDMLGEAARTFKDADRYFDAYMEAINTTGKHAKTDDIRQNPGISVKLSALHPRYEETHKGQILSDLVPRVVALAKKAATLKLGFNIDAEEQDRLDLSLDIILALLEEPALAGWDGLGIVVQAYGPRVMPTLEFLAEAARLKGRRIMVRLVKGAYWDTEIKRAQTLGLSGFPVFTRKTHTDVAYIAASRMLLNNRDIIYPQFATHNAHTVSAVLKMAGNDRDGFEFQRLHGMGEALHEEVRKLTGCGCRIYAPVGTHKDLLAYLVRRLLENGANSSFVNQIVDISKAPEDIATCPLTETETSIGFAPNCKIQRARDLYGPDRPNSEGFDWTDHKDQQFLLKGLTQFSNTQWSASPTVAGATPGHEIRIFNPAVPDDCVGRVQEAAPEAIKTAINLAKGAQPDWAAMPVSDRGVCLTRAADLYEKNAQEFFSLLVREAGKSLPDAIAELREAVDFLRYYAHEVARLPADHTPCGVFTCISPWNFPLAIFTGQIAAALVTGNSVLAKPADQTPLVAAKAVSLLHQAGVPLDVLILLPGSGRCVGVPLTQHRDIDGICFTGSTATAGHIHKAQAAAGRAQAPLIAETGGLNAMIVDSSALPEQAVRDIVGSSFQSAGQRCSALRIVYLQEDTADIVIDMLKGAMDALSIGDPANLSTDVGPVIDQAAQAKLLAYCDEMIANGCLLKKLEAPKTGTFVAPHLFSVPGIDALAEEQFGPILHVARFKAADFDAVIDAINAKGYGLTFGLHTRIETRVERAINRLRVGNVYVNRNQIGAIVGSQPFGGEGLSGTGPKAGGPLYLTRFVTPPTVSAENEPLAENTPPADTALLPCDALQGAIDDLAAIDRISFPDLTAQALCGAGLAALDAAAPMMGAYLSLPGPTGESNRWRVCPKGLLLIAGPANDRLSAQVIQALALHNRVICVATKAHTLSQSLEDAGFPIRTLVGSLDAGTLEHLEGIDGLCWAGDLKEAIAIRKTLASRAGAILPLITEDISPARYITERHVCIDTTAAGGNAALLANAE